MLLGGGGRYDGRDRRRQRRPEVARVRISRARRAEMQRRAAAVRLRGQRAGLSAREVVEQILAEAPGRKALEAWRLAYGWSRRQALDGIAELYEADGLAAPPIDVAMLCRWEHGDAAICVEYAAMLIRLYQASTSLLGLVGRIPGR